MESKTNNNPTASQPLSGPDTCAKLPHKPACKTTLLLILTLLTISGCGKPGIKRLTSEPLPRKAKKAAVDVYIGNYPGKHKAIAIVNSISLPEKQPEDKARQVEDLKKRARELGGDAIHQVRLLPRQVNGYILDENVPIRSWKQGKHYIYFLRGTVIQYDGEIMDVTQTDSDPFKFKAPADSGWDELDIPEERPLEEEDEV